MTTGDCLKPTLYIAWLSMVSKTDIFTKERIPQDEYAFILKLLCGIIIGPQHEAPSDFSLKIREKTSFWPLKVNTRPQKRYSSCQNACFFTDTAQGEVLTDLESISVST